MENKGIVTVSIVIVDFDKTRLMTTMQELQQNSMLQVVGIAQSGKDAISRAIRLGADAVLMDYSMPDCTAAEVSLMLKDDAPGTSVFAISDNRDAEFIASSKRVGIIEVFPRNGLEDKEIGLKIAEYVYSTRTEWEKTEQTQGVGQRVLKEYITKNISQSVILTYNNKGGVGRSSIAANLALAVKMSPYLANQRIALVDFDCSGGNISTLYNIPDSDVLNRNLSSWESKSENITTQEVDDLMIRGSHGIMVLPAPLNMVEGSKISFELCNKILSILKRHFPIIVIDGAPNITSSMDAALRHSTHILLITNSEGQSVKQLTRTISLLSPDSNFPEKADMSYLLNKMYVVLNHAHGSTRWDLEPNEVAQTIGRPLLAEIPFSESIRQSLHCNEDKQAIEIEPNGEFTKAIKKLANDLVSAYPIDFDHPSKDGDKSKGNQKKGGLLGLFTKK